MPTPSFTQSELRNDLLASAAFSAAWFGALSYWRSGGWLPQDWRGWMLVGIATALCVAIRRAAPLGAAVVGLIAFPVLYRSGGLTDLPSVLHLLPVIAGGVAIATVSRRHALMAGGAAAFVTLVLTSEADFRYGTVALDTLLTHEILVLGTLALATTASTLQRTAAELRQRNEELERLRAQETARAVREERVRIARELHDVIAHYLTALVVRTQASLHIDDNRSPEDQELLLWVVDSARDALSATRSTVSSLRDGDAALWAPVGNLDAIEAAAQRVRSAGIEVEVHNKLGNELGTASLGWQLESAIVRVVQESLTNVLKHSTADRIRIELGLGDDDDGHGAVRVAVHDNGTPPSLPLRVNADSHGLIGLRERAAGCGGTVEFLCGPLGGWTVQMIAPLDMASPGAPASGDEPSPSEPRPVTPWS